MAQKDLVDQARQSTDPGHYRLLDQLYLAEDKKHIRRTRNIRLIPEADNRRGGKYSYAEWAHVIGIFQTLMYLQLNQADNNDILDVGCGTGLLGIASEPFLGHHGHYVGLDVMKRDIDFCRTQYPLPGFEFIHFDIHNRAYASSQRKKRVPWPLDSARFDLVTALSVWTHLNEDDALFYFKEVDRVLKPGSKAIITCFLLDAVYEESLATRSPEEGRYHMLPQDRWVFDQPSYGSKAWFHPQWTSVPEQAIGITKGGLNRLISESNLELVAHYHGNWKEVPGVFFQDVLVFEKA